MQYPRRIFCSDDVFDSLPEDDVDKIFRNLEQVEPPQSVIDRILSSVKKLPLPQEAGKPQPASPQPPAPGAPAVPQPTPDTPESEGDDESVSALLWRGLDGLVVRKEQCEPS